MYFLVIPCVAQFLPVFVTYSDFVLCLAPPSPTISLRRGLNSLAQYYNTWSSRGLFTALNRLPVPLSATTVLHIRKTSTTDATSNKGIKMSATNGLQKVPKSSKLHSKVVRCTFLILLLGGHYFWARSSSAQVQQATQLPFISHGQISTQFYLRDSWRTDSPLEDSSQQQRMVRSRPASADGNT